MKAYSGIAHEGECALAFGISVIEADIETVNNIAIKIAIVLLFIFSIFIFLNLIFIFIEQAYMDLLTTQFFIKLKNLVFKMLKMHQGRFIN